MFENSIRNKLPFLVKEWDFEKNGERTPDNTLWQSNKKAFWLCEKNHSFTISPNRRIKINQKTKEVHVSPCPYCSGNKILAGFNDIVTTHPELMKQWDFDRNTIDPHEICFGSHLKAWWKCEQGHGWKALIESRTRLGRGCPYCAGKTILPGYNDLETLNPKLAKQWHPTKNNGLYPDEFTATSHKKVWWLCEHNHEWQANIFSRVKSGCPYCSGFKPIVGETDLTTLMPEIADEWNYEKNRGKTPDMFTKFSNRKVWWICKLGHEWRAVINTRTGGGTGCPECAKKRRNIK